MKKVALLVDALAAAVLVVGCGGGSSSSSSTATGGSSGGMSRAEYIETADAVCGEYQDETAPLREEAEQIEGAADPESPKNLVRLAEILREAAAIAVKEYAALKEVDPPSGDRSLIDSKIAKAEESQAVGGEGADALEEGDLSKFSEVVEGAAPLNLQAKGMAVKYGFKVCGQAE